MNIPRSLLPIQRFFQFCFGATLCKRRYRSRWGARFFVALLVVLLMGNHSYAARSPVAEPSPIAEPSPAAELPPLAKQTAIAERTLVAEPSSTANVSAIENRSLLQRGISAYSAGQFVEARSLWQQALASSEDSNHLGDPLYRPLVLHYLSLAHQQLGQWREAEESIATSLALLRTQPSSPEQSRTLARVLNTQGRLAWLWGQSDKALELWQQAAIAYQQGGDRTGLIMALINQANAQQSLGFSTRAEEQLQRVYQLVQEQPESFLKASSVHSLGNALRQVGRLIESRQRLQEGLSIATAEQLPTRSAILLDLGNTERALAQRAIAIGKANEAQRYKEAALQHYEQSATLATTTLAALQSRLNQLPLLAELEQTEDAARLAGAIATELNNLPTGRASVYARLNFARSLMQMNGTENSQMSSGDRQTAQLLASAVREAEQLQDTVATSYAIGQLGELYERNERWTEAQQLTEKALYLSEANQIDDLRYRWEWQLGRLRAKVGDRTGAIAAYRAAVASLQKVRGDLLPISADVQFSFRDAVEPVYRGLVDLLLTPESREKPSQENLRQALRQVDALQLAELENFLRCDLGSTVALNPLQLDPTAAKLYPILLENRLAVVVELPNGQELQYYDVAISKAEVESTLRQLRRNLRSPDRTPEAIAQLKTVYDWLIKPLEPALAANPQVKTLVFVLDGELRNIPMSALYDGQSYLISRYAVALAPRVELFRPERRSPNFSVFLGGVGEPQTLQNQSFPKIENLTPELNAIGQLLNATDPLLDNQFTESNLQQQLSGDRFSAIHIKTHGVFSSDPEETFIVAYRDLITGEELGRLIRRDRAGASSPIELLVLSACSTAEGDNRAVLGLAGIAIQSGARSVVSTLWEAQDVPNTQLMIEFYRELVKTNVSRAEALRQAQLHLLEQGYRTPHVWSTYVLVGNWM